MDDAEPAPVAFYRRFAAMMAGASDIAERRRLWEEMSDRQVGLPETRTVADTIGGVAVQWISAPDTPDSAPVLVFLHGGGFAVGASRTHQPMLAHLALNEARALAALAVQNRMRFTG